MIAINFEKDSTRGDSQARNINYTLLTYSVSNTKGKETKGSLVDRGANGGLAGYDSRVIAKSDKTVDVTDITNLLTYPS